MVVRMFRGESTMQNDSLVLIALAAGLVLALVVALVVWRKRSAQRSLLLREHFGPEYDRVLAQHKNRARAEKELSLRHKRVEKLNIQQLSAEQCARFGSAWSELQQRFVDDPSAAVSEADRLVKEVMSARGYPMSDFEQRVADLSVEHASVLNHYRSARAIAETSARGEASTEDLRQAMVHYRALFTDLLQVQAQYAPRLSSAHA
jgi:hypothetical protein